MKRHIPGFLLLMAFDTLAQFSFKLAGDHALPATLDRAWLQRVLTSPWVAGAIIGYLGAFTTWMNLLKQAPIGPAFAASHLEVVSVALLSVWFFHEPLTMRVVLGAAAIVAGIICLALSESAPDVAITP
ncbi:DMT family transporter [Aerosticca soli]|jgi:drug/metabolite transporter (DMT)-like permease|uniref:DMT family transporter n=1 Tax=Aerosticca soli TaxID=2010829 RepID=UPI000F81FBC8|nr:EamA family transporter [Aerosticca soli]MDI3262321.1 EamA family transporter [Fulvimonas sp.]